MATIWANAVLIRFCAEHSPPRKVLRRDLLRPVGDYPRRRLLLHRGAAPFPLAGYADASVNDSG
jgi:hypothetical protein